MNFQEQIAQAAKTLTQEGDSIEVVPNISKPKQFRDCQIANTKLKEDGISVVWSDAKLCAIVSKVKSVVEEKPKSNDEVQDKALFSRFSDWGKDEEE